MTAQKLAAQQRFAQQQQGQQEAKHLCLHHAAGLPGVDAAILQQEQARLMRQDLPLRMFWLLLLCSVMCCTVAAAGKVSLVISG